MYACMKLRQAGSIQSIIFIKQPCFIDVCGSKNGHNKYMCLKRDWTMCSQNVRYFSFDNQHDCLGGRAIYDDFRGTQVFILMVNKTTI